MRRISLMMVLALLLCGVALAAGARQAVSIKGMQFAPRSITIKAGDTVVWTNNDDRDHSVVADDGSFNSGTVGAGQSFEHKFAQPGTYSYGCSFHPRMKGTVVVQ